MNIQEIFEHSVDLDRLHKGCKILDIGCRDFYWPLWFVKEFEADVYCFDPDKTITPPDNNKILFTCAALSHVSNTQQYVKYGNGYGNYLYNGSLPQEHTIEDVQCHTLKEISDKCDIKMWDLLKLDCEGSEYEVLMQMDRPYANQITVEFHQHTAAKKDQAYMDSLFKRLSQWYEIVHNPHENRHCAGVNYWDCLMLLK